MRFEKLKFEIRYAAGLLLPLLLFFFWAGVSAAAAQDRPEARMRTIQTTGEATVSAPPDRARLDIGVTTQAATSQAAAEQNAQKLAATLARLRGVLGQNADIRTIAYSLNPVYRYPREGGQPTITGYTATNIVRATIDDLTLVGRVIDAATQAGANQIQQLQFTLKDEQRVQAQALKEAAVKARQKAEAIADALNLRVLRIVTVSEGGQTVVPVREVAMAARVADAVQTTPIEAGTIEIRASIGLVVEVG